MKNQFWKFTSMEEAIFIQNELCKKVVLKNIYNNKFSIIAGVDSAYWKVGEEEYGVCCIVVLEQETKRVIETKYAFDKVEVPYIAGCLAFRELPLILKAVEKLEISPELYIFDGNGYLHPRHMGIATHASFYLDKPTIGVAKSYYKVQQAEYKEPENKEGAYTDINIKGEIYGRVLRTRKNIKPIFLSPGNYIDWNTATKVVCDLVNQESHIPLPTRLADIETHKKRKELMELNKWS